MRNGLERHVSRVEMGVALPLCDDAVIEVGWKPTPTWAGDPPAAGSKPARVPVPLLCQVLGDLPRELAYSDGWSETIRQAASVEIHVRVSSRMLDPALHASSGRDEEWEGSERLRRMQPGAYHYSVLLHSRSMQLSTEMRNQIHVRVLQKM